MIEAVAFILATLLQPPNKSNPNDEKTTLRADVAACMREVKKKFPKFDAYVGRDETIHWYSNDAETSRSASA